MMKPLWNDCESFGYLLLLRRFTLPFHCQHSNKMLKSIGAVSCVEPYLGSGRYFAESWIGTAPNFKPADCFDVSIDTDYIYNYWVPSSKLRKGGYCPNFRDEWSVGATQGRKWGGTCGNASMLVYPDLFKDKRLSPVSKPGLCTSLKYARARSKLWYGAEPELQIRWRALFGEVAKN